jgi:hypothetical protein
MVARYQELMEDELAPYWVYKSALLENTRASHAAMHNKVYHRDSAFWDTWYPPNAWNCQCYVVSLTEDEVGAKRYKVDEPYKPNDDPSWGYKVGATDRTAGIVDSAYSKAIKELRAIQFGEWGQTWQRDHVEKVLTSARQIANDKECIKEYEAWVDKFYDDKGKRIIVRRDKDSEIYEAVKVVGVMDIRVFDYFANNNKTPLSAIVSINGKQFAHTTRDDKVSPLNKERMKNLPKMLANPSAILWDKDEQNVLYVYDMGVKDKKIKLALCVKYIFAEGDKRNEKYNMVITGSRVATGNLKNKIKYDLISGSLD